MIKDEEKRKQYQREYHKKWYAKNKKKVIARVAEWKMSDDIFAMKVRGLVGKDAERSFVEYAREKHRLRIVGKGWPDFLCKDPTTRKVFGVEVKSHRDTLSTGQVECFGMLEEQGIGVFVWWTGRPDRLIPWRKFLSLCKGVLRDRNQEMRARRVERYLKIVASQKRTL